MSQNTTLDFFRNINEPPGTAADSPETPDPYLCAVYETPGRLVEPDDTPETAQTLYQGYFSLSVYAFPIADHQWSSEPLLRFTFGANQDNWFNVYVGDLPLPYDAVAAPENITCKLEGQTLSTHTGTATKQNGRYVVQFTAHNSGVSLTIGDSLGTGATAEFTPFQTSHLAELLSNFIIIKTDDCYNRNLIKEIDIVGPDTAEKR